MEAVADEGCEVTRNTERSMEWRPDAADGHGQHGKQLQSQNHQWQRRRRRGRGRPRRGALLALANEGREYEKVQQENRRVDIGCRLVIVLPFAHTLPFTCIHNTGWSIRLYTTFCRHEIESCVFV